MKSHVQSTYLTPRRPPELLFTRKTLGGLFVLERQEDGSVKAELSAKLQRRFDASYLGMSDSPASVNAHKAIFELLKVSDDFEKAGILFEDQLPSQEILPDGSIKRVLERENLDTKLVAFAFLIVTNLQGVFEPLKSSKGKHLEKATKRAKKIMGEVIEKIAHPLPSKSDVREKGFWHPSLNCHVPLPFMAITKARLLAAEHQRLPTKAEVRNALISIDPEFEAERRDFWSDVWRKAGLDSLPKGKPEFAKQKGQLKKVASMSGKTARK